MSDERGPEPRQRNATDGDEPKPDQPDRDSRPPAGFVRTAKAVFWSFFGVRKRSDHEHDAANLNPVHVLVAGVIGALLFVLVLVLIVKTVVR